MSRALPTLNDRPGRVNHADAALRFNADPERVTWHDATLWYARVKRDRAAAEVPEWEQLRELASQVKEHTLTHLDEYLEQFEREAQGHGVIVHWARDAEEHNTIVHGILRNAGVKRLVKSKSMLTEECGLNPYLEARGIDVVDTDLGERIVQLRREGPSHIVAPAIHLKREDIARTFAEHLGTDANESEPKVLVAAARLHLRERFLAADAALTGANFAIASTGGVVVCTNEGNADLGIALAPIHIASIGIEKLVPSPQELAVFLRLLARSGTGQRATVYTTHVHAPEPGRQVHFVLVDNGRSRQLAREDFWRSLKCIRCGACMNTCPVYRRSGGYSYGSTVPGPIGAVLAPGLDLEKYASLPFASTLCGSCTAVCPVKIDLDAQLLRWREIIVAAGVGTSLGKRAIARAGRLALVAPWLFDLGGRLARATLRHAPRRVLARMSRGWSRDRELPAPAPESFRQWYARTRGSGSA